MQDKVVHLAVGKHVEGSPEIIDIWIDRDDAAEGRRTRPWREAFARLQRRGVEHIDVVAADRSTLAARRLQQALESTFPASTLQGSMAHLLRNSLAGVSARDRKPVTLALRSILASRGAASARTALIAFSTSQLGQKYPSISLRWNAMSCDVEAHFALPRFVRQLMIVAVDATEDLRRQLQRRMHSSKTCEVRST